METVMRARPALSPLVRSNVGDVRVLFGVISGLAARRRRLRRWFADHRDTGRFRVVYVVAEDVDDPSDDLLRVPVREGVGIVRALANQTPSGTLTTVRKLVALLQHAAAAQEEWLVRIDDDVLVNVGRTLRYARLLKGHPMAYGGVFEWYNMHVHSLRATGHGYGVEGSRAHGRHFGNCTPVFGPSRCVGPFAFAKGPWLLMGKRTVVETVRSAPFATTVSALGSMSRPKHRVHDDALLGMWVSTLDNISYIRVPRKTVWLDRTPRSLVVGDLLMAHKPRAECMRRDIKAAEAEALLHSFNCVRLPPCASCLHATTQQTCWVDIRSNSTRSLSC